MTHKQGTKRITRCERKAQLAEVVSEGMTLRRASEHLGMGFSWTKRLWAEIVEDMGAQAV